MVVKRSVWVILVLVQVFRNFSLCGLMVNVAYEAANNLTLSVLKLRGIVIQVKQMLSLETVVKRTIVPIPTGVTDAKHVCVLIMAMPPGAMASKVIFMIITLRNMETIHGVIPIGETGNAIPILDSICLFAQQLPYGNVLKN